MRILSFVGLIVAALLSACSTNPIQQDQPLLLAKGEGLAAVVINTTYPMNNVLVQPAGTGGNALKIPFAPIGRTLYLFQTQAGNYCLREIHFDAFMFYGRGAGVPCFVVPAGQIGYSGDLEPLVKNGNIFMSQNYNFDSFRALLQKDYPKIAAQFAPPPPDLPAVATQPPQAPPPLPEEAERPNCNPQVCSWGKNITGSRSQALFIKNRTQWPIRVDVLQLYDCVNIKQPCTTTQVSIKVLPHASKKIFVVDPADPAGAYDYQFRFEYTFDLSGHN